MSSLTEVLTILRLRYGVPSRANMDLLDFVGKQDWRMDFYKVYGYFDADSMVTSSKKFETLVYENYDNRFWLVFESEVAEYLYSNSIEL